MVLRHSIPVGHANSVLIHDTLSGTSGLRFKIAVKHPAFISLQDVGNPTKIVYFPIESGKTYKLTVRAESAYRRTATSQEIEFTAA